MSDKLKMNQLGMIVDGETLFYDDICFMSWEETKDKYLTQVGR